MITQVKILKDSTFENGFGFTLIARYRNFTTRYILEIYDKNRSEFVLAEEYQDIDKALKALEVFESKPVLN